VVRQISIESQHTETSSAVGTRLLTRGKEELTVIQTDVRF
jgi:hypothetical protein